MIKSINIIFDNLFIVRACVFSELWKNKIIIKHMYNKVKKDVLKTAKLAMNI